MPVALINQENMGRLNRLQYRVETPYKNGPVDHLFEDYQKAIKYCDQQANEFGVAQLFNHLTNKVIHFSVHETNYEANKANADFRDLEYEPNWTYNVLNRVGDKWETLYWCWPWWGCFIQPSLAHCTTWP